MANPEIKTDLKTIFHVTVDDGKGDVYSIQFKVNDKKGLDAEFSLDGVEWVPASAIYHAIKSFEARFPEAFDEP